MDKKRLHHLWTRLRALSPWYFLGLAVVCGLVSVSSMRHNNLTMINLRNEVAKVDQEDGDVEAALKNLREYVYAHMNTNLSSGANSIKPPVQLKYRYDRLVQAEKDRVSTETAKVYTDAQTTCERLYPQSFSGGPRVPCIQDYVASHTVKEQPIDSSLYKFDFVSPAWSPDLAGWSLLAATLFSLLFAAKYGLDRWLKAELNV